MSVKLFCILCGNRLRKAKTFSKDLHCDKCGVTYCGSLGHNQFIEIGSYEGEIQIYMYGVKNSVG